MELFAAERQIRSLLKAQVPPGTPVEPAPYGESRPLPAVVYKLLAGEPDTIVLGGQVVMSTLTYEVFAVGKGENFGDLAPIVRAIEAALHGKGGSNGDGTVFSITRQRPLSLPYRSENGATVQQVGFLFRVEVKGG